VKIMLIAIALFLVSCWLFNRWMSWYKAKHDDQMLLEDFDKRMSAADELYHEKIRAWHEKMKV
jgi:hypothetical protein